MGLFDWLRRRPQATVAAPAGEHVVKHLPVLPEPIVLLHRCASWSPWHTVQELAESPVLPSFTAHGVSTTRGGLDFPFHFRDDTSVLLTAPKYVHRTRLHLPLPVRLVCRRGRRGSHFATF